MTDTICTVCGLKIKNSSKQKTGRPRQYHDGCRKLLNAISLLENNVAEFKKQKPIKEKRNFLRGEIWRIANGLN